jgi:acyl dehydratase
MPLRSEIVDFVFPSIELFVTPRMALAYGAGIGEDSPCVHDDAAPDFVASPFFCVTPEWQFVLSARQNHMGLTQDESIRAVHAGQATRFLAALKPGRRVRVDGKIVAIRQTRAGALSTAKMDITDLESGTRISSTLSDSLYRGVEVDGPDRATHDDAYTETEEHSSLSNETIIPIDRWFAHRYSECASIWNPIHTERRAAHAAGLSDCIVHGTALWALAGKSIAAAYSDGDTQRITSLRGRFSAMVFAGTAIAVRHARMDGDRPEIRFAVLNQQDQVAISGGLATLS